MVTESRGEALNAVLNSVIRLWRLVTRATTPLIALIDDIHDQSRYVYVHMHTYTRTHTCNRQRVLMPARSSIMLIVLFKCLVLPISIIESDSCLKKIMLMHQMNYAYWSRNNPWWLSSCNVFPCLFFFFLLLFDLFFTQSKTCLSESQWYLHESLPLVYAIDSTWKRVPPFLKGCSCPFREFLC